MIVSILNRRANQLVKLADLQIKKKKFKFKKKNNNKKKPTQEMKNINLHRIISENIGSLRARAHIHYYTKSNENSPPKSSLNALIVVII